MLYYFHLFVCGILCYAVVYLVLMGKQSTMDDSRMGTMLLKLASRTIKIGVSFFLKWQSNIIFLYIAKSCADGMFLAKQQGKGYMGMLAGGVSYVAFRSIPIFSPILSSAWSWWCPPWKWLQTKRRSICTQMILCTRR